MLAFVWENPDSAEPALLAGALRVSRQSMTGLLDKLERGGYLERTPHAADRRRKTIRLRKKGLAVVRGFAGGVVRREAALFGTRSEREVSGALDTLDRLLSLVEQWHAEHPFDKANS